MRAVLRRRYPISKTNSAGRVVRADSSRRQSPAMRGRVLSRRGDRNVLSLGAVPHDASTFIGLGAAHVRLVSGVLSRGILALKHSGLCGCGLTAWRRIVIQSICCGLLALARRSIAHICARGGRRCCGFMGRLFGFEFLAVRLPRRRRLYVALVEVCCAGVTRFFSAATTRAD